MVLKGNYSHALGGQNCLTAEKMTKASIPTLLILAFLLLIVKGMFWCIFSSLLFKSNSRTVCKLLSSGSREKITRKKHERKIPALPFEKIARSALIGLKPEDVFKVTNAGWQEVSLLYNKIIVIDLYNGILLCARVRYRGHKKKLCKFSTTTSSD